MFTANSRYYSPLPPLEHTRADGTVLHYTRRRILADPDSLTQIGTHIVKPGERLDVIAAAELGDAEQAWRIADAHRVADPDTLTERPARVLRITLPAGFGGSTHG